MKRYSKKVREEAALIASIGACNPATMHAAQNEAFQAASGQARKLYLAAWTFLDDGPYRYHSINSPEHDAEAHALLLDGWSPP